MITAAETTLIFPIMHFPFMCSKIRGICPIRFMALFYFSGFNDRRMLLIKKATYPGVYDGMITDIASEIRLD